MFYLTGSKSYLYTVAAFLYPCIRGNVKVGVEKIYVSAIINREANSVTRKNLNLCRSVTCRQKLTHYCSVYIVGLSHAGIVNRGQKNCISLSKFIFKEGNVSVSIAFLNQSSRNLTRTATSEYVMDTYRNVLGRYILFSVSFNFGKMNAKKSQAVQNASWDLAF